jgi:hypothetical protein
MHARIEPDGEVRFRIVVPAFSDPMIREALWAVADGAPARISRGAEEFLAFPFPDLHRAGFAISHVAAVLKAGASVAEGMPHAPQCGWPRSVPALEASRIMPPRPVRRQWVTVEEDRVERGHIPPRS